jgi:hypothetical protein
MMGELPRNMTPEYLADLAVDNGECAAQIEITDKVLRDSLVLNVKTQMERLVKWFAESANSYPQGAK